MNHVMCMVMGIVYFVAGSLVIGTLAAAFLIMLGKGTDRDA